MYEHINIYLYINTNITHLYSKCKSFLKFFNSFNSFVYVIIKIYSKGGNMQEIIELKNLKKAFKIGKESLLVLKGIDLTLYKEQAICIVGPSGSGKSTLLNMMAGLEKPTSGEIVVGGIHIENLNEDDLTKFRQLNVGFVFQSYNLIPTLTALENVGLGLIFKGIPKKERDERSAYLLEKVGLKDRMKHKPSEMSGGQQQRVSIARAFVNKPKIVFADEPTGNLDTKTSVEIMELMTTMTKKDKQTLIIVTHDLETAVYSDRIVHVRDGLIEKDEVNRNKKEAQLSEEDI